MRSNEDLAKELLAVDSKYEPFPAVRTFASIPIRPSFGEYPAILRRLADRVGSDVVDRSLEVALRKAAFDTGAIEDLYQTDRGLTLSVALAAEGWEEEVKRRSDTALALFQAQLAAYEHVRAHAEDGRPVTEVWIRELHETLTEAQETYEVLTPQGMVKRPLPRGKYKTNPNHVRLSTGDWHAYCPVGQVQEEMHRLVDALNSAEFRDLHPVIQASYSHYAFVLVHPFADGNGRVARTLASYYLFQAFDVPMLLYADQKVGYLDALESADQGDHGPFVDLMQRSTRECILEIESEARGLPEGSVEDVAAEMRSLLEVRSGLTELELDRLASTARDHVRGALSRAIKEWRGLPENITVSIGETNASRGDQPVGYRPYIGGNHAVFTIMCQAGPPIQTKSQVSVHLWVATGEEQPFDVFAVPSVPNEQFGLVADVIDSPPANVVERLDAWARRLVRHSVDQVLDVIRKQRG